VELINAVTAVGKPAVAVVSMGRPQGLAAVIDRLPAVLTAYYGGPHQGTALADALFGVTNPEGKLPYTLPRHVGQVPIHHGQKTGSGYRRTAADIHKGYLDMPSTPLFAFGHGLSYTTFEYSPLKLESDTVDVSGKLQLSLTVTNTGGRRGTEVVQLYVADTATGVTLPEQQLVGFARVELEPRASKTVKFVVPMSLLGYTGRTGQFILEPGPVEVSVGSSSSDIRSTAKFTVTGKTRSIKGEDRAFLRPRPSHRVLALAPPLVPSRAVFHSYRRTCFQPVPRRRSSNKRRGRVRRTRDRSAPPRDSVPRTANTSLPSLQ
jgi:beta-xylosidase